jgi:hypothetical protein
MVFLVSRLLLNSPCTATEWLLCFGMVRRLCSLGECISYCWGIRRGGVAPGHGISCSAPGSSGDCGRGVILTGGHTRRGGGMEDVFQR